MEILIFDKYLSLCCKIYPSKDENYFGLFSFDKIFKSGIYNKKDIYKIENFYKKNGFITKYKEV